VTSTTATGDQHVLRGLGVAPGVATGRVHLIDRRRKKHAKRRIAKEVVAAEVLRLEGAWSDARELLEALQAKAGEHSAILEAHLLMLADPLFVDGARKHIVDDLKCAEWAIRATVHEIRARFDALDNAYFRERRSDVDFVGDRLLDALGGDAAAGLANEVMGEDAVVVAHELSPADAIALSRLKVRGFVTEVGGATSHTAILARALEIPAVIACKGVLERAASGEEILVDGLRGEVVLSPTPAQRARFETIKELHFSRQSDLKADEGLEADTPDGRRVSLLANVEVPDEVPGAVARGAGGVGLYRSEFLFLNRTEVPSDVEHEQACEQILAALDGRTATLRTFDLGSDKLSAAIRAPREQNPALGLRGVRLGLARLPALRAQLRGMVRALSRRRHGQILLPMIGSVEEVLSVRALLREEMDLLSDEGVDVWREIPVGVMIELPAAVWIADALADVADFFSVGTNDLIQYMLAIDRGNEHVAHLYQPLHPAVLRALKHVVDAGHKAQRPVSLCGEMASDPAFSPVVLGLGFDSLSMPVASLRAVKHVIRRFRYDDAQTLVEHCLAASTSAAVQKLVRKELILRGLYDAD
jgi:phosphotransferase system enzyme I (PtsI)